ncbi:carbon starvation protein A [Candidatus Poribacteria bacterium]|nr:carbon starvation protein A [Candidatus Poribacteria bacterium]
MPLLAFILVSATVLFAAYALIGGYLRRSFGLSGAEDTPAFARRDGVDFEPARTAYLLPQHFSAIAAAGPVVGPILAALYFGWGPAWLWLILGAIFIGGIHDFTALVASVRHRGQSVAEVIRQHMNPRAHKLFLIFTWFALIYVIIAFADVTAATFAAAAPDPSQDAPGPAVATSSMIYLALAVLMGLVLRHTKLGPVKAKLIFLPLVAAAIVLGPVIPLDLSAVFGAGVNVGRAWSYLLLAYCFVAALAPVWILLQPRGELGGYFLYVVIAVSVAGIIAGTLNGGMPIEYAFFKGWVSKDSFGDPQPLFPILFITVACGACSGFHSIVASGTTSKQLRREVDARPIGYGSMLLEAFLACISLATVMVFAAPKGTPNAVYANGIAEFGTRLVSPFVSDAQSARSLLFQFALLCFSTFVFDTLDACTRLGRYMLMELLGWTSRVQAYVATALTLALPVVAISLPAVEFAGVKQPLWKVFWAIFGSSNQLLAALTLLGITVWLARKRMAWWLTFFPTVFMMTMTLWSLGLTVSGYLVAARGGAHLEPMRHLQLGISLSLIALSAWLIVEAVITWWTMIRPGGGEQPAGAAAMAG